MNPRFSIIVPLYNKAPYVRKALDSIVSQTFSDWECIIVDDGSTDGSLDMVQEVKSQEPRAISVRIISQQNAGVAAARNNGVKASQGEFLCFLDADDWWEPTFLKEMDWLIKSYPDAGLYATNFVYYKKGKTHVEHNQQTGYINYPDIYYRTGSMPVWTGAACMPRKVFDEMGGFPVGIKLGEDFLLWAKTALHYKVAFCEKPLAYYNNDVPTHLRATRNLHAPQYHMLFHLDAIEEEINRLQYTSDKAAEWKSLLDKLRISGLMEYWLNDEYHGNAASELSKVDWTKQMNSTKAQYKKPIWQLKVKCRFMQIGSYFKQKLIRIIHLIK